MNYLNQIITGEAFATMKQIPPASISFIITAPPHFSAQPIPNDENCVHNFAVKSITGQPATGSLFCVKCGTPKYLLGFEEGAEKYVKNLCNIFDEAFRLLKDDGICCVTLGDTRAGSGSLFGVPFRFAEEMRRRKWVLKDMFMLQRKANSDMDHIFVFTKNDTPLGKWNQSPLKVYHGQETVKGFGYGAFPANMVSRLIEIYCPKDGVVMDFFCGSGMVLKIARDMKKQYVGIEVNASYAEMGRERVK